MKKQTKDNKEDTEESNQKDNKEETEKQPTEEEEKVKKARKVAPKFTPEMLNDPNTGLEALFKRVQRLDENTIKGNKESLDILMKIYQKWIFQVFPADFGDMCSKLNQLPAVKKIVKNFVFDKKGFNSISSRILDNFIDSDDDENEKKDEENFQPPPNQEKSRFLDEDDDIDLSIPDNFDKNTPTDSQTSEILDFIGQDSQ